MMTSEEMIRSRIAAWRDTMVAGETKQTDFGLLRKLQNGTLVREDGPLFAALGDKKRVLVIGGIPLPPTRTTTEIREAVTDAGLGVGYSEY